MLLGVSAVNAVMFWWRLRRDWARMRPVIPAPIMRMCEDCWGRDDEEAMMLDTFQGTGMKKQIMQQSG